MVVIEYISVTFIDHLHEENGSDIISKHKPQH